jgi:uncharacterized BrkB/YihY/UPF0761 family membrane protein
VGFRKECIALAAALPPKTYRPKSTIAAAAKCNGGSLWYTRLRSLVLVVLVVLVLVLVLVLALALALVLLLWPHYGTECREHHAHTLFFILFQHFLLVQIPLSQAGTCCII